MEIPNYDSVDYSNKKYKQLFPFMPSDTFWMLICGNSGCGKTNLLYHMLIKPLLHYDEIYLYARNLHQDKYQNLIRKMNESSSKTGYEILHVSDGEIIPVTELEYEDNQKLVIFDDYVCDKNQKKLIDYFMQGRHKNCSVIYLSQSFFKTPFEIRKGCTHYCYQRGIRPEYHLNWELTKKTLNPRQENHIHFYILINPKNILQKTLLVI